MNAEPFMIFNSSDFCWPPNRLGRFLEEGRVGDVDVIRLFAHHAIPDSSACGVGMTTLEVCVGIVLVIPTPPAAEESRSHRCWALRISTAHSKVRQARADSGVGAAGIEKRT
jgi:hypothetical protein